MAERIISTEYSDVMQKSYIDYAMSVICARALPDARDGLKPVQRRVLYAMEQLGLSHDKPHRKSARIVGDTMGKYHPHGDSSIYETLVVMAQDFKKGMALVDGHGNFGSIEGDGAAAMRYTEARLKEFTEVCFLSDLNRNVVDFKPTFEEVENEPEVLPVRIPNLLVNGAEGIAVGMATNIPTHNLGEVIDAVIAYMKNNSISTGELMTYLPGPDFPTGGIVANKSDLPDIYESGTGKLKLRGTLEFEKGKRGSRDRLVVTSIPYTMIGSGISKFISDVIDLCESKTITEIVDISNASDKDGIRIVFDLKRDTDIDRLRNILYKKTKLEDTFGVNMLAIVDGRPETMGLKDIIRHYVDFQYEITTRKYRTLLDAAMEDKEVKEGLIKATNIIDLIIEIIRGCQSKSQVKKCLTSGITDGIKFKNPESEILASNLSFTDRQAQAIMDLRLYRLIGLEIMALEKEYQEIMDKIAEYEDILENKRSMTAVIKKELLEYRKKFAKERKTIIEDGKEAVFDENAFVEQEVVFVQDKFGYARLLDPAAFDRNIETLTAENKYYYHCMNTDSVLIFTDTGVVHRIKIADIPSKRVREKGVPIDNLGNYDSTGESIVGLVIESDIKGKKLLFTTEQGMIKLVDGSEFESNRKTMLSTKLIEGDKVVSVNVTRVTEKTADVYDDDISLALTGGSDEEDIGQLEIDLTNEPDTENSQGGDHELQYTREILVLQTDKGIFLRFPLKEVPEMKKGTRGVRGIKLSEGDFVSKVYLLDTGDNVSVDVLGKTVELRKLKIGKRGTKGVKVRTGKKG